jgi:hypothetical protein
MLPLQRSSRQETQPICGSAEMRNTFLRIDKDFDRGPGGLLDPDNLDIRGDRLPFERSPNLLAHLCGVVNQRFGFVTHQSYAQNDSRGAETRAHCPSIGRHHR